jgi:hypothetical protein
MNRFMRHFTTARFGRSSGVHRDERRMVRRWFNAGTSAALLSTCLISGVAGSESVPEIRAAVPSTPREAYNAGATKLREGKLREAESLLQSVLASQQEQLQPPALYNLGHVRFRQGAEELKKGPARGAVMDQGRAAASNATGALGAAESALREGNLQRMVTSYLRGRGTRRELRAALGAVRKALERHEAALTKWQRASADFRSVLELRPKSDEAAYNAKVVDRNIAKLVDSIQELQQMAMGLGQQKEELNQKLKQLRGRIPEPDMPPGASGDDEDEDEDEPPKGPEPGQKEAPNKTGEEMTLSPEQAGWLLEGFKLDTERRLPMGLEGAADPKNRPGKDW